jgi:short subunit dehydrogenase-like uncharacterized protein
MPGDIIVFGATGHTGELLARALVREGSRPRIAGRSRERLQELAGELGGLDIIVADAQRPDGTVRDHLGEGDVLVTTVGPFLRHGEPAVNAAIRSGAHYLDSTGEPPWIRRVFEVHGPRAEARCALVPAFGYDFVPGNLAAGLALREAGEEAVRVDVGYFTTGGGGTRMFSEGTARSAAGVVLERGYAWRGGRLIETRAAERVRSFAIDDRDLDAISIGSSEHLSLPRVFPRLEEVNVHLGWFGPYSKHMPKVTAVTDLVARIPGVRPIARRVGPMVAGIVASGGPDGDAWQGSRVAAVALDRAGRTLSEIRLDGPDGYTLTGELLAWAARRAAEGEVEGTGALGPVEAFGLDGLERGCAEIGLARI